MLDNLERQQIRSACGRADDRNRQLQEKKATRTKFTQNAPRMPPRPDPCKRPQALHRPPQNKAPRSKLRGINCALQSADFQPAFAPRSGELNPQRFNICSAAARGLSRVERAPDSAVPQVQQGHDGHVARPKKSVRRGSATAIGACISEPSAHPIACIRSKHPMIFSFAVD